MKNIIVVTGGAGFIGSNLIELLIQKTNYKIISLDNYSTGSKLNHINSKKVTYLDGDTSNFEKIFKNKKNKISTIFHFAEFSRIHQSFANLKSCLNNNIRSTLNVINFCINNNIKIVYSATSASLGNNLQDQHLSPYAYSKSVNMNLLINLKIWKKLKSEIIFFYNVYGPKQISKTNMATVIGIFEQQYIKQKKLTIVSPGIQTRSFTHVSEAVKSCYYAWKRNKNSLYTISSKKTYSIIQIARLFRSKYKFIPPRKGERYKSNIIKEMRGFKVHKIYTKIDIKDYINNFINNNKFY